MYTYVRAHILGWIVSNFVAFAWQQSTKLAPRSPVEIAWLRNKFGDMMAWLAAKDRTALLFALALIAIQYRSPVYRQWD